MYIPYEELGVQNSSGNKIVKKQNLKCPVRSAIHDLPSNPGNALMRYAREKGNVTTLAQGQGDRPTPDFITDAAMQAAKEGKTNYTPVLGIPELRRETSDYYKRIYGLDVPESRIFVTGSGTSAMHYALTAVLDKGDHVVAVTPIWKNLLGAVRLAQANTTEVPMTEYEGQWSLDLDRLFAACRPETRVLLINSPSNPTGWVMDIQDMQAILDFARARNLWIISDEVYGRITYDGKPAPSFLNIAAPDDRLFVVNSFSKSWAMTGWRLGWLVGPESSEDSIYDIALYNQMCPVSFNQFGGIAALRHGEEFIADQLSEWRINRTLLDQFFKSTPGIEGCIPMSGFYGFFKVEGEPNCFELCFRLIENAKLCLAPGCAFGDVAAGYVRLCFAVSRLKLENALDALQAELGKSAKLN